MHQAVFGLEELQMTPNRRAKKIQRSENSMRDENTL